MAASFQRSSQALANAAEAHDHIATQITLLPQAPAIQAQEILALLQAMDLRIQAMDSRMQAMDIRVQAMYYNTSCMMANQLVRQPDTLLRQLHDVTTNQEIPDFPLNLMAIQDERSMFVCLLFLYVYVGINNNSIHRHQYLSQPYDCPR